MSEDGSIVLFFAFIFCLCMSCLCGSCVGNDKWKDDLVDRPGYISAIKSSILAERAVVELSK